MKKCPFCAEEIQDAAIVCKHCRHSANTSRRGGRDVAGGLSTVLAVVVAVLGVSALIVSMLPPAAGGSQTGAYSVCKTFVEGRLESPESAEFQPQRDAAVAAVGFHAFIVRAYVDSQNGFGATLRRSFECEVEYAGSGKYTLVRIGFNQ